MKARGKLVSLLMALVCLLPIGMGLLGFGDSASAANPGTVDVTLHKKKMDDFPVGGHENTGEVDDYFNKYDPLPGVKFQTWDITEDFYDALAAAGIKGDEDETTYKREAEKLLKSIDPSDSSKFTKKQTVGSEGVTGTDGTVKFPNLPAKDADGVYKVYWFEELDAAQDQEFSQPVVLMLPVMKVGSSPAVQNDDIHLYPKNKLPNLPEKILLDENGDTVTDNLYSFDVGRVINYKVSYKIPIHVGEYNKDADGNDISQTRYSKLVFKDEVNKDGVAFNGIQDIKIGNDSVMGDFININLSEFNEFNKPGLNYQATGSKAGFEIKMKFNDSIGPSTDEFIDSDRVAKRLKPHAGKTIDIYYSVKLTEDTEIDEEIKNDFYVDLQQSGQKEEEKLRPKDPVPSIITGGKKFVKIEKDNNNEALKGAEFVVTKELNGNTVYLKGTSPNNYTWDTYVDNYTDAFVLRSGDNGLFEVKGLKYGDYKLVETKAPNGFKIGGPFNFVIDKDSYDVELPFREKIENVSRGGFLPSTGGIGIAIFLIIGGSLMGFAVSRYRKQQHAA